MGRSKLNLLYSKCAKRYRILIKQQEDPEQEDNAAPATKRPQKRAKNLREIEKRGLRAGDNEAENTLVVANDGPSTRGADVLPLTQDVMVKAPRPKPKPKPKPTAARKLDEQLEDKSDTGRSSRGRKGRKAGESSLQGKQ